MTGKNEDAILQDLMNKILLVAMDDGIITDDELAILKQVKLDIKTLREKIRKVEQSEETPEEEAKILKEFRKNLLQNAYNISREDKVISKDERDLINCLIRSLMS